MVDPGEKFGGSKGSLYIDFAFNLIESCRLVYRDCFTAEVGAFEAKTHPFGQRVKPTFRRPGRQCGAQTGV